MPPDTLIPFLAVFAATAIAFLLAWLAVASLLARRRHLRRRIGAPAEADAPLALAPPAPAGRLRRWRSGFDDMIARTGLEVDGALAAALVLFCGVALAAGLFVWRNDEPWLALPGFFLGAAVPLAFFYWRQGAWRRAIQYQLPDVLYLLARSLRAGRSIDQAIQLVGDSGVPPLAAEFARMHRQLELGLSLGQVLQATARRLRVADFNVFASVVSLHRSTGGNLAVVLDRLAAATRDHNQFEGQYRAATVLGRYSAGFITCLAAFILFYLFFFQRDWALRFFESGTGVSLFATALLLELSGLLLLFWFLRTDY